MPKKTHTIVQSQIDYNEIYGTFLFDTTKITSIHTKKVIINNETFWETTVEYIDDEL